MKFTINRTTFLEELSKANKLIDIKITNPSLLGILIEVNTDNLVIISSSGLLSFKSVLNNENSDLEIMEPGKILIKTKYILELLRRMEEDFITFSLIEKNELKIETNKSQFEISVLDPEDFPIIGFRTKGDIIEVDSKEFKKAVNQVIVSIFEWNKKIILSGMNFKINENNLILSGTDLYRISQKKIDAEIVNENEKITDITLPFKTILELPKMIEGSKKVKMYITEGYITFEIGNSLFQSNLIDGQFPNVAAAFPKEFEYEITIDSRKILKSLNRANLPMDDGLIPITTLKINDERIIIKSSISEIGNYEEIFTEFDIIKKTDKNELNISFNSKYLLDAIKTFEGEIIQMKFNDPTKPIIINIKEEQSLKQVVLPTYIGE